MHSPKITLITIAFNAEKTIKKCLDSVKSIKNDEIEYIFIDGASTDKTLSIAENYKYSTIDTLVSESDEGIYDAYNKGLSIANGEFIIFVNADDWLLSTSISDIDFSKINKDSLYIGKTILYTSKKEKKVIDGGFDINQIHKGFNFLTPCVIFSKHLFKIVGDFDINFKIAGDVDWFFRASNLGIKFYRSNHAVIMTTGGISNTMLKQSLKEYKRALIKNNLYNFKAKVWHLRKYFSLFLKSSRS